MRKQFLQKKLDDNFDFQRSNSFRIASMAEWRQFLISTISKQSGLQTWYGHLDIRLPELDRVLEFLDKTPRQRELGKLLEIGCGNGIGSAYFSPYTTQIIATDLENPDPSAHAIGLDKVNKFFQILKLSNASVQGCSADRLPFADESFDSILSIYSLEHIRDREQCLAECRRVLKTGGRFVATVPAFAQSFFYPLAFYQDTFLRVTNRVKNRIKNLFWNSISKSSSESFESVKTQRKVKDFKSFRKSYPHFPFPEPHGAYDSFFEEFWYQRPSHWKKVCESAGFNNVHAMPISLISRVPFEFFLGKAGLRIHQLLEPIDKKLIGVSSLRSLSQFICLICTK